MGDADSSKVSDKAKKRGIPQLGSLGSGNHFLEVQKVDEIFDEQVAQVYGLEKDQVTVLIHSGSRGCGHQVCSDYLRSMDRAEALYESMELRGFCGDFSYAVRRKGSAASWPYAILCPALMLLPRLVDLSALAGSLFV